MQPLNQQDARRPLGRCAVITVGSHSWVLTSVDIEADSPGQGPGIGPDRGADGVLQR